MPALPLDAIWAYELRQEQHFDWDYPPFNLSEGLITTANGVTYDLAQPDAKARLLDEGLVYWADTMRAEIRAIDPTALVTMGFFVPNEPHPVRGDDPRLVRTAYFLRHASVDFVDLHHYRGNGVDDNEIWENFGLLGVDDKPIVLGEQGADQRVLSQAADRGARPAILAGGVVRVRFRRLAGVGVGQGPVRRTWWANDGDGRSPRVVSPHERPDPCVYR